MIFLIIGLTGKNCTGKGTVADYLMKKNFVCFSLSDIIRDELTKEKKEHSRDNMIQKGNELRKTLGPGCLAVKTNEKIKATKGYEHFVIDSIRSPFEVKELRKNKNFILVNLEAPIEVRFKRMLARNRVGDAKTLEELEVHEAQENKKSDTSQQIDATIEMADETIANDSSFEELYSKIDEIINEKEKN